MKEGLLVLLASGQWNAPQGALFKMAFLCPQSGDLMMTMMIMIHS